MIDLSGQVDTMLLLPGDLNRAGYAGCDPDRADGRPAEHSGLIVVLSVAPIGVVVETLAIDKPMGFIAMLSCHRADRGDHAQHTVWFRIRPPQETAAA